jgi:uncharacterized protein (TIGR02594 family)
MNIPENFSWLKPLLPSAPKMVIEGLLLLGIAEIKGQKSNPAILKFAADIGVQGIYKNDDTSWCALSHNAVALRAGKKIFGYKDKYDLLRALAFLKNGIEINKENWLIIEKDKAAFGDSLIFKRPGGGHIGIYLGESKTHYYVLGGNQNNMYSITRIAKYRLEGVRRPVYNSGVPGSVKKYYLNDTGTPETTNEA